MGYLKVWIAFWCLVFGLGCYNPERNLTLDPYNKSLVHLLASEFNPQTGAAEIRWEYIGSKPVESFRIERRSNSGFEELGRVPAGDLGAGTTLVSSFKDTNVLSGEKLQYRVIAEHVGSEVEITETVELAIPGVTIVDINRDPVAFVAQIQWAGETQGIVKYELVRKMGDASEETVWESSDVSISSYQDKTINNNELYTYRIRSHFSANAVLDSRPRSLQFYRFGVTQLVEGVNEGLEQIRLASGDPDIGGGLLALVSRNSRLTLNELAYSVGVAFDGSPRILRTLTGILTPEVPGILPLSVAMAGPAFGETKSLFPQIFIGGITATGQVHVARFDLPLLTQGWTGPTNWSVNPNGRVLLAKDAQQRVYVVAGNELRVFDKQATPIGALSFNGTTPGGMAVFDGVIWLTWPELDRVERGVLQFSGTTLTNITWQTIALEAGAKPLALANNAYGQVFVLNSGKSEMVGLKPDGTSFVTWKLPTAFYSYGDVAIDATPFSLVQVSNGRGDVLTYVP